MDINNLIELINNWLFKFYWENSFLETKDRIYFRFGLLAWQKSIYIQGIKPNDAELQKLCKIADTSGRVSIVQNWWIIHKIMLRKISSTVCKLFQVKFILFLLPKDFIFCLQASIKWTSLLWNIQTQTFVNKTRDSFN